MPFTNRRRETADGAAAYLKMMVRFVLTALIVGGLAFAQDGFPLRSVEIVGSNNYPEEAVVKAAGLTVGDLVTPADFEQALQRISAIGVFDKIEFRYVPVGGGYAVTFTVQELEQLYEVRFEGFDESAEELKALILEEIPLFTERLPSTGPIIEGIGDFLQARWRGQGHDSRVIGQLEPAADGGLVMLFRPQERLQTISHVSFQNTQSLSAFELQGFFNRIARGEPYSEPRLQELLSYNVRPLYEEQGRMGVKFCPCTTADDPDNLGLVVSVHVEEGEQYTFGNVPAPEINGVPPEKIEKLYAPQSGKTVNMKAARASQAAIEEALRANGFLRSRSQLDVSTDHEAKTVDLVLQIDPGYRYTFDRLHIQGLDILAEPIIRKRWGMSPGDPYTPTYPNFFLQRLQEENAFENLQDARWKEEVDETTKRVTVTLQFFGRSEKRLYPDAASDPVNDPF